MSERRLVICFSPYNDFAFLGWQIYIAWHGTARHGESVNSLFLQVLGTIDRIARDMLNV